MSNREKKKVIVAMSGGVDSSVVAKMMVDAGYDVLGIFLSFWKDPNSQSVENKCCSAKALSDARAVCTQLGIRLYVLDFADIFKKEIVDNFLDEYRAGKTPNPCVRCNKFVKLGLLIKKAKALGYSHVATGHYAQIKKEKSSQSSSKAEVFKLLKGVDKAKDQSYYLYKFNQEELSSLLFPLGEYTKTQTRVMAEKANLLVASKSDSQEICFTPNNHNEFLRIYLTLSPGEIRTPDEAVVGKHQGLPLYTLGQRRGIEIGGVGPYYVLKKDQKNNILYVTNDENNEKLFSEEFIIKDTNWLNPDISLPLRCEAKVRYGANLVECIVDKKSTDLSQCHVQLLKPVRAITSGQSVVFYNEEEVLGGGIIAV